MKKSILNLGEALNKAKQKEINGGMSCNGPSCYGIPGMGCGTCEQYHQLSNYCKVRVFVHISCETADTF
ncbi:hypothetical protein DS884_17035 [Tenacibaculum sp. E3R01]|uniref:hypothetical protein n=1 Tax=Tenacibaculum sp. E3R01 TaxID=2267227 RepID=UPI000DE978F4|nr:hypothetical protein [Tenacibaculum sp. E3R01]RBW54655.1 hypothetical protein DS884_17035 [Tenacibaculum sp. E3R01]